MALSKVSQSQNLFFITTSISLTQLECHLSVIDMLFAIDNAILHYQAAYLI